MVLFRSVALSVTVAMQRPSSDSISFNLSSVNAQLESLGLIVKVSTFRTAPPSLKRIILTVAVSDSNPPSASTVPVKGTELALV
ncbi:MAG: hypothetical protein BWY20_02471 [Spirochaetes bacterium ADurb.Bin215]|nr:MAG: hypothetical protein BWY20_02471 [Spirochaetes bacterium ADurb.Bin215]